MPNSNISSGVISDPPPTPVIPTSAPTQNPESVYSGLIRCPPIASTKYLASCRAEPRRRTFASALHQPRHILWHNLARRAVDPFGEEASAVRGFEVEPARVGTGAAGLFDKAGGWLDAA